MVGIREDQRRIVTAVCHLVGEPMAPSPIWTWRHSRSWATADVFQHLLTDPARHGELYAALSSAAALGVQDRRHR
jgi:hypothetical protein